LNLNLEFSVFTFHFPLAIFFRPSAGGVASAGAQASLWSAGIWSARHPCLRVRAHPARSLDLEFSIFHFVSSVLRSLGIWSAGNPCLRVARILRALYLLIFHFRVSVSVHSSFIDPFHLH
jgi:hypothetical protein